MIVFAQFAEHPRRRDHDQRFEVIAERAALEQIGHFRSEAILLLLVIVGLVHRALPAKR